MPNDEWTPADVTGMIANPFYAIEIDENLATPHEPIAQGIVKFTLCDRL